jgi:hypothetical protein
MMFAKERCGRFRQKTSKSASAATVFVLWEANPVEPESTPSFAGVRIAPRTVIVFP